MNASVTVDRKQGKELWFEVTAATSRASLEKAFNLAYSVLFVPTQCLDLLSQITLPHRMQLALSIQNLAELELLEARPWAREKAAYVFVSDRNLLEPLRARSVLSCGVLVAVADGASLKEAVEVALKADVVIVELADPTNIPLELVLASTQASGTRVLKKVSTADDGVVSLLTMERGSDGVLMSSGEPLEIVRLSAAHEQADRVTLGLEEAVVTAVHHAGMGDRVCIDTTSELFANEGMLLGSTSSGGLLVCSETHYLPYMNLRPFRVNAGGLHLYLWGPDDTTVYLSDLRAGDRALVFDDQGHGRTVTIGRLKIERRPLLMISAKIQGQPVNVFVQDDWHVRLFGAAKTIRPSSEIKPGDRLLGCLDRPGRHVGLKLEESIREL